MIVQRVITEISPGADDEWTALNDKVFARYEELGFPRPKVCKPMFGGGNSNTYMSDAEWESLSVMEEAFTKKLGSDPELIALRDKYRKLIVNRRAEVLLVL